MGLYLNGKLVGISLPQQGGGMDTVTATNYTESAISTGDKVWINKVEDGYNVIDFSDITQNSLTATASTNMAASTKALNVLDVDTAVNNNGVVSDLTKGLKTKTDITLYKNKSFEIGCKVTRGSNTSDYQEIFTSGELFLIRAHNTTWSGVFWVNGSWRGYETGTASANTTYYTRVRYFPTATTDSGMSYSAHYIYFEVSTDNFSWTRIYSYDLSTNFIGSNPSATETTNNYTFGSQGTADELWKGSIDFNNTYFKVDGNVVWNGTTLIPGGTGDVEIGTVIEPTLGTKTITINGTYSASTDNLDGYSSVTVNVPSAPTKKYNLLDRVKDDNNNEIGTVSGFFTDDNNVEYAVVCLDAQYRLASSQYASTSGSITNLPLYSDLVSSNVWTAKETATFNTQKILDWCSTNGYTSTACSHCRSKSFVIGGVTYYGQLPNIKEVVEIAKHYSEIESMDTSASSNTSLNFSTARTIWSSSQCAINNGWCLYASGALTNYTKTSTRFACPVLEIPNT